MARLHMNAKQAGSRLSDTMVLCSRLQSLRMEECPLIACSLSPEGLAGSAHAEHRCRRKLCIRLVKRLITSGASSRRGIAENALAFGAFANAGELILRICLKSK